MKKLDTTCLKLQERLLPHEELFVLFRVRRTPGVKSSIRLSCDSSADSCVSCFFPCPSVRHTSSCALVNGSLQHLAMNG